MFLKQELIKTGWKYLSNENFNSIELDGFKQVNNEQHLLK